MSNQNTSDKNTTPSGKTKKCAMTDKEMAGLAGSLAITLTSGKTDVQVKTLVNLFSLVTTIMSVMLDQRNQFETNLEIETIE